jgi:high-affinity nickel-transport protein
MSVAAFDVPAVCQASGMSLGRKMIFLLAILIVFNLVVWLWALTAFHGFPVLLAIALVAYLFGLRHAVDADHIAAIDNVTRKLMQQGQRPVGVGFFFSLGHSTIVFGLSVAIALTSIALKDRFDWFENVGGLIGTTVSAFFLIGIALVNMVILVSIWRTFRAVRRGEPYVDEDLNLILAKRGFFGRIFRSIFRLVTHSWQMYFVGFLFGLGFDTATEVGVLGISAASAAKGMSIWAILVFPALFTCGMALVDSLDSMLMVGAYGWAFAKPLRKLYYNLTITAVSILVALVIGGIETLGLVGDQMGLKGAFWNGMDSLNNNFTTIGFTVIGIFLLSWIASMVIYKAKRYDEIQVSTATVTESAS